MTAEQKPEDARSDAPDETARSLDSGADSSADSSAGDPTPPKEDATPPASEGAAEPAAEPKAEPPAAEEPAASIPEPAPAPEAPAPATPPAASAETPPPATESAATTPESATPTGTPWWKRAARRALFGLATWLIPIRRAVDEDDGTLKLVYTSFPKSFYLYLIWLPGYISLALHGAELVEGTRLVWILFGSAALFYLVVAENFRLTEFFLFVALVTLAVLLYNFGIIDFAWLRNGIDKLRSVSLNFDPDTIRVISGFTFAYWCAVYIFSVTWRKRELSSNRRALLRPPRGKKILPVLGRIVDNQLHDVLELVFGFGAYDVVISETSGRELDRDRNCVGLFLYINFFGDLVGRIATRDPAAAHEMAVAASESGGE